MSNLKTAFRGTPVNVSGTLPEIGSTLPDFTVTTDELAPLKNTDLAGQRVIYNIFPSVDTGVCATSVREFNQRATDLDGTVVVNLSRDLPFALGRFCGAENTNNARVASDFRHEFGDAVGLVQQDGPLAGLLARSVIVTDAEGRVLHTELVDEIATEPNYDAAIAALS